MYVSGRVLVGSTLAVLLIVMGCGSNSVEPESSSGDYYPLEVGNLWNYHFSNEMLYASGDSLWGDGQQWTYVHGVVEHNHGFQVYHLEWSRIFFWFSPDSVCIDTTYQGSEFYERITAEGVYSYSSLDDSFPSLKLILPPVQGDSWQVDSTLVITIQSICDEHSVPSGSYSDCLRTYWDYQLRDENRTCWYAKDVGWVSTEGSYVNSSSSEWWDIDLTGFSENADPPCPFGFQEDSGSGNRVDCFGGGVLVPHYR